MLTYKELNVNPKGRKTGDCSTRALVSVTKLSYDDCLKMQMEESLKHYYDPTSKQTIEKVLAKLGWVKMKQPRKWDGSKYLVKELDQILDSETRSHGVLVTVANHYTAVVENEIVDIWNCGKKSIGNYWVKV